MKKLCPNLYHEDGLETVLEVPIPEDIFTNKSGTTWKNMKQWMKPNNESRSSRFEDPNTNIQLLLGVVGAPLIPFPITNEYKPIITRNIKGHNIEASMAKYIVKQYVAAVGGESVLNNVESMYAMGEVRIGTSEFVAGEGGVNSKKVMKKVKKVDMKEELGGFVLWQKRPELWCLELVVSGYKISAGSDGKVAWRQTPWHHSHASRGPPRPLKRLLQGLDPKSTANLFNNSTCIGEKTVNNEECFILKLEAESTSLQTRSSSNIEIIGHTVLGYFSQRTGLLVQLEDTNLIKLKSSETEFIFWETNTESLIQDYRIVDGIQIAHCGKTWVTLSRFGEGPENHSRTSINEVWKIEEVDFNIKGLSLDCFLPPSDLKRDEEKGVVSVSNAKLPYKIQSASFKISVSKVAAIDVDDSCVSENIQDM
ncbi:hypothetical protein MtrunA17_Chr5g0436191 [Medicago truncatula]|uniref:Lipase n=2 Tax=Medicago truncatula TaxID=3880 RepID=G7KBU0_MEDTR|nr:uncharacterized protein LOC11409666 isoform X1 [Medicago truncatula]AES99496.1 lipase [Medicago truncatula]RHN57051.1 hypothetical protein MtrunA17_Chr5g0436191 [Medicago truncatula]